MTMNQDSPIVAEVRRIRHEIAERCGNDIRKIIKYSKRSAQEFLSAVPDASANLPAASI
jgi:hypothetical protein